MKISNAIQVWSQHLDGIIGGTVVDYDDLAIRVRLLQRTFYRVHHQRTAIERRNDDRDCHHRWEPMPRFVQVGWINCSQGQTLPMRWKIAAQPRHRQRLLDTG